MKICMIPWTTKIKDEELFSDDRYRQFGELKKILNRHGHDLFCIDKLPIKNADAAVFFDAFANGQHALIKEAYDCGILHKSVYFALEPPVVCPLNFARRMLGWCEMFKTVLAPQTKLDGRKNIVYGNDAIDKAYYADAVENDSVKKKLLTSISSNKRSNVRRGGGGELYSERIRAYKFFQQAIPEEFEFYGTNWDFDEFPSYKGLARSKRETLERYKFALAFENMENLDGYITEKVIDVMKAGAIPIYKGAPNVTDFIPKDCLILADDFKNYDDLLEYLKSMTDTEYYKRIASINEFLNSEKFYPFSMECFVDVAAKAIESEGYVSKRKSDGIYKRFTIKIKTIRTLKNTVKKIIGRK